MQSTPTTTRAVTGHNDGHLKTRRFITELAARDPTMPLGAILILVYLYEHRGLSGGVNLRKLREDLDMTSTIATRSIYYWNEDTISVQIDPKDRRGRRLWLTPIGEAFVQKLEAIVA